MASKPKTRSAGKSPSQSSLSGGQGHGRRSARHKEQRFSTEGEKETLAFKILSEENTKKLAAIDDVDELQMTLADILQLRSQATDLKEGSTLDYYVAGVWWGKEQGYSHTQLSALYTVVHTLLENVTEKQMTVTENLKEFRKMLAGIGQDTSPEIKLASGGLETIFDIRQAKAITDYVYTSLFQHYRLFEFMHSLTQDEEIIGTDLELELPSAASLPWPPPLDEGVSEEMFQQYIATPPATPDKQEGSSEAAGVLPPGEEGGDTDTTDAEADLLTKLTPAEIQDIMDSVFKQMLGGLETEVAAKLREKENAFINRINKVHKVSE